ncbi:hypothetical protein IJ596_03560 [bacterium]|nr:hypothetical protein [bacterium]
MMQNFGNSRTSILTELPNGNAELGEAFAVIISDMVVQSGITNPEAETFEVTQKSWRELAKKPDKTPEDAAKLDKLFKESIYELAESYLLFIARQTKNLTGKIDYQQYESYLLKFRFGRYDIMNKPEYLNKVKVQIRNAFKKMSAHGEEQGDNLIDKHDMAAYIYALCTRSRHNESGAFAGFEIDGVIKPEEYAVNERNLFEAEDNLMSLKLRIAYKALH